MNQATAIALLLLMIPTSALVGSYCNADGSTSVAAQGDFRYNSIVFGPKFKPQCSCTNNMLHCHNECETCFRGVCGVMETSQIETSEDSVISNYSLCITYTGGRAPIGGTTCFNYDPTTVRNMTQADGSTTCDITYNGESCTWCKMYEETGCLQANCTNILKDARINTCWTAYQGVGQQFRLATLVNNITSIQKTKLGSCGYSDLDVLKVRDTESSQNVSLDSNDTILTGDLEVGERENAVSDQNQKASFGNLLRGSHFSRTMASVTLVFLVI